MKNIIGALAFSKKIVQKVVTWLHHRRFLPSTIEPNEPITAIEKILEGKQKPTSNRVLVQPGNHRRDFKRDEQVGDDFLLNLNVLCISLRARNVNNEMTNKQSKFQSQVSALANDTGGYIYHGIKSGKVVGVPLGENAIQDITSGASVAQWSDHFTSKVPSSIPSKVILMWTRTQSSCEKSIVNALPKVVGFLRVLRFPPTGKVDWVG